MYEASNHFFKRTSLADGEGDLMGTRITRRKLLHGGLILGATLPIGLGLLTACAEDDDVDDPVDDPPIDDDTDDTEPVAPDDDEPEDDEDEPEDDSPVEDVGEPSGTLRIGIVNEPLTLDPQFAPGVNEYNVCLTFMEGLFDLSPELEHEPKLAESVDVIDELTWEFRLREGITFHNGEPFNAEAVKVTYDRTMDETLALRNNWAPDLNIDEVEVVDEHTVRFHTSEVTPHMLGRISFNQYIFPPQYVTENDPDFVARNPVGTGPYIFQEWVVGERITLEANPDYWGEPKPGVETLIWTWMTEYGTRLANFRTGQIDIMSHVLPASIEDLEEDPEFEVVAIEGTRRVFCGMNTKVAPFDDIRVRQAINYGTNVEEICEVLFHGATERLDMFENVPYKNPEVEGYYYDPDLARQLLEEAGYPDGFSTTFDYTGPGAALGGDEFPTAIAISLGEIGVDVELNIMEDSLFRSMLADREAEGLFLTTNTAYFEPGLNWNFWIGTGDSVIANEHASNSTGFDDPRFVEILDALYTTSQTAEERLELAHEAQAIHVEHAPILFLWRQPEIYATNQRVQNFSPQGDERLRVAGVTVAD